MEKHDNDTLNHQDLFHRGTNFRSFEYFGSHKAVVDNVGGAVFRLWAPNAIGVSVVGSFCDWEFPGVTMDKISEKGIYEVFIPGIEVFDSYKYAITSNEGEVLLKTDPYAYHFETRPSNASKLYDLSEYEWKDGEYLKRNKNRLSYD
ncbi:MAG: 1,4-alpha-glucan branching enzyme, partial [Ruminococcaceae bacterium]|nr:1,4-alpha-glucan branching enzyme [Oscillospiraceae bacterium]